MYRVGGFFVVLLFLLWYWSRKWFFHMARDKGTYLVQEAEHAHRPQGSTFSPFSARGDSDLHSWRISYLPKKNLRFIGLESKQERL